MPERSSHKPSNRGEPIESLEGRISNIEIWATKCEKNKEGSRSYTFKAKGDLSLFIQSKGVVSSRPCRGKFGWDDSLKKQYIHFYPGVSKMSGSVKVGFGDPKGHSPSSYLSLRETIDDVDILRSLPNLDKCRHFNLDINSPDSIRIERNARDEVTRITLVIPYDESLPEVEHSLHLT
jgi:hypothetical protein